MREQDKRTDLGLTWPSQRLAEPHRELDYSTFATLMFCGPYAMDRMPLYDQIRLENDMIWHVHYYSFPGYLLAVAYQYESIHRWQREGGKGTFIRTDEQLVYGYVMRYFRVGCEHKFGSDESRRRCEHTFTCQKCGYRYSYDSSD